MIYKRQATDIQKRAVNAIIAGEKNVGKAMVDAGYSEASSQNPKQNLMDRRGVRRYLLSLDGKAQKRFQMSAMDKACEVLLDALDASVLVSNASKAVVPDHRVRLQASDRITKLYSGSDGVKLEETATQFPLKLEERNRFDEEFKIFIKNFYRKPQIID